MTQGPSPAPEPTRRELNPDALYRLVKDLSRGSLFFAGHDEEALRSGRTTLAWSHAANRTCGDSLTLAVCADSAPGGHDQSQTKLCYAGYFCALCHAMAELVCLGHSQGLVTACNDSGQGWHTPSFASCRSINVTESMRSIAQTVALRPARKRCTELPLEALQSLGGQLAAPLTTKESSPL